MNPINDQQLDEIEQRANAAFEGPWVNSQTQDDTPVVYAPQTTDKGTEYAHVLFEADWGKDADAAFVAAARTDVPALVAEVRRLRAAADRTRALTLLEAANFLRDAFLRDPWLSVQEIGTALRNTADQADPMVGSLARDGFGPDEIAEILARPAVRPAVETGA